MQKTSPIVNTHLDFQPSNHVGGRIGQALDFPVNFFSGGMLARDGEPLTDHTIASGVAGMALPGWKGVGYARGMSKEALTSLIFTGYIADKLFKQYGPDLKSDRPKRFRPGRLER